MYLLQIITQPNSDIFSNILTGVAILIGGVWTFWRFVLQREAHAKIQFDVDLNVVGIHHSSYIVEVIAVLENKGAVRHHLENLTFEILQLTDEHDVKNGGEKINHQLLFEKVVGERSWIPAKWGDSFVDPGVVQRYTYITHLPLSSKFALLHGCFKYQNMQGDPHTTQRVFNLSNINE